MAGQPAAPQLAISVLAAPPRRTEAKKVAGPPPKISTFRRKISAFRSAFSLQLGGCDHYIWTCLLYLCNSKVMDIDKPINHTKLLRESGYKFKHFL
jgi:hypothetical protein